MSGQNTTLSVRDVESSRSVGVLSQCPRPSELLVVCGANLKEDMNASLVEQTMSVDGGA